MVLMAVRDSQKSGCVCFRCLKERGSETCEISDGDLYDDAADPHATNNLGSLSHRSTPKSEVISMSCLEGDAV
jgi:hypothetical protein